MLATSLAAQVAARSDDGALASAIISGGKQVALASAIATMQASASAVDGELHLMDAGDAELVILVQPGGGALLERRSLEAVRSVSGLDGQVALERAVAAGANPLAWLPAEAYPLHRHATLLVAAQLVGNAEATRDMAAEHAKVREQFGKPIGSFQAISHYCADMAVRAEAALAQTLFATIAARDARDDADLHAAAAALIAQDAAFRNATINIRIHGGLGFTAECDAHHFLKRSMLLTQVIGGTRGQQDSLLNSQVPVF